LRTIWFRPSREVTGAELDLVCHQARLFDRMFLLVIFKSLNAVDFNDEEPSLIFEVNLVLFFGFEALYLGFKILDLSPQFRFARRHGQMMVS
jgi:hypothetical protein